MLWYVFDFLFWGEKKKHLSIQSMCKSGVKFMLFCKYHPMVLSLSFQKCGKKGLCKKGRKNVQKNKFSNVSGAFCEALLMFLTCDWMRSI